MLARLVLGPAVLRPMQPHFTRSAALSARPLCIACFLHEHGFATAAARKLALRSWPSHLFADWGGRGSVAAGAGRTRRGPAGEPASPPGRTDIPPDVIVLERPASDAPPGQAAPESGGAARIGCTRRAQPRRTRAAGEEADGAPQAETRRREAPGAAATAVLAAEERADEAAQGSVPRSEAAAEPGAGREGGGAPRGRPARRASGPFMSLGVDDRVTVLALPHGVPMGQGLFALAQPCARPVPPLLCGRSVQGDAGALAQPPVHWDRGELGQGGAGDGLGKVNSVQQRALREATCGNSGEVVLWSKQQEPMLSCLCSVT